MRTEYIWAIVSFVIVGVLAVWLLYLGSQGSLPALGLFNMENLGVRIAVIIILAVAALVLLALYNSVRKRAK